MTSEMDDFSEDQYNVELPKKMADFAKGQYNVQLSEWPFASGKSLLKGGVNGEVFKVKIAKTEWAALSMDAPSNDTSCYYALKWSKPGRKEQAKLERDFLQALKHLGVHHQHLVMCYACFEFGGHLHFIMQLGNGNLNEFMRMNPEGKDSAPFDNDPGWYLDTEWLLEQMRGLAEGLDSIHRPGNPDWIGYHHDIKPENILYFITGNHHLDFRITDWTTAKISQKHPQDPAKDINGDPLGSKWTGWPAYLPHETLLTATTCPPDVWSLGCVFVELLIWFHWGYSALDNESDTHPGFRQHRRKENEPYHEELVSKVENSYRAEAADFNTFHSPEGSLLGVVTEVLDSLCKGSGIDTHWHCIIDVIKEMLIVDADKRPAAKDVWLSLRKCQSME